MYKLGNESLKNLAGCHADLQKVFKEAIKDSPIDFTITCGHRNEQEQNEAFKKGFSKLKYPLSKHNELPSNAVDCVPYPKMWDASEKDFKLLSCHIKNTAKRLGIKIKWGGDWLHFTDKPHYEL